MLCGKRVLSPNTATWISSSELARKLKKYGKRTIFFTLTWRNVHGDICSLIDTPFLELLRKQKPETSSGYVLSKSGSYIVHKCEEEHSVFLYSVAHIGAVFMYAEVS